MEIKRAKVRDAFERIKWGLISINALELAAQLVSGIELSPGQRQQLSEMPETVQNLVENCYDPHSRYLPKKARNFRAAFERLTVEGRRQIQPKDWNTRLQIAIEADDWAAVGAERAYRVVFPKNIKQAGAIRRAIAIAAQTNAHTLRRWENEVKQKVNDGRLPRLEKAMRQS